jgi:hypothetical protein
MGLEIIVSAAGGDEIAPLLQRLADRGQAVSVIMVDGALHAPSLPVPSGWREVRLKTAAGMVTLKRRADGIGVVVFGNADAALTAAQQLIAAALRERP